jgi:hypothetical protein
MARVRAFLASLGHDELTGAARIVIGSVVVFVPFGSIVLLTRWAPIRRFLQKLGQPVAVEGEPAETGEDAAPLQVPDGRARLDIPADLEVDDGREEPDVHEVPPVR